MQEYGSLRLHHRDSNAQVTPPTVLSRLCPRFECGLHVEFRQNQLSGFDDVGVEIRQFHYRRHALVVGFCSSRYYT